MLQVTPALQGFGQAVYRDHLPPLRRQIDRLAPTAAAQIEGAKVL
jgi:hypothetical protein